MQIINDNLTLAAVIAQSQPGDYVIYKTGLGWSGMFHARCIIGAARHWLPVRYYTAGEPLDATAKRAERKYMASEGCGTCGRCHKRIVSVEEVTCS